MNDKPHIKVVIKVVKREDKPVHPDLRRLVCAMRSVLKRRYTDPGEREAVAQKIMREMQVA